MSLHYSEDNYCTDRIKQQSTPPRKPSAQEAAHTEAYDYYLPLCDTALAAMGWVKIIRHDEAFLHLQQPTNFSAVVEHCCYEYYVPGCMYVIPIERGVASGLVGGEGGDGCCCYLAFVVELNLS